MLAAQNGVSSNSGVASPKKLVNFNMNGSTPTSTANIKSGLSNSTNAAAVNDNISSTPVRRIELDDLVKEFRNLLGEKRWSGYYLHLCKFLLGKLSKNEFHSYIAEHYLKEGENSNSNNARINGDVLFRARFIKLHNKFLLATLANAFRDPPNPNNTSSDGFGYLNTLSGKDKAKNPKSLNSSDFSEREKLKKDVMSLTIKERRRIKNISRNTNPKVVQIGKRHNLGSIASERYELLPKIPAGVVNGAGNHGSGSESTTKNNTNNNNNNNEKTKSGSKASVDPGDAANGIAKDQLPDVSNKKLKGKNVNQLSIQVDKDKEKDKALSATPGSNNNNKNLNLIQKSSGAGNAQGTPTTATTGNVSTWTQEIMGGFQTLLASESFELPDLNALKSKMLGIMREHGLIGNINDQTINIMLLGLENYLKNIVEAAIDTVRYRKVRYDDNRLGQIDYANGEITATGDSRMDIDSPSSPESATSPFSPPNATAAAPAGIASDNTAPTTASNSPKLKDRDETRRKRKITLTTEDLYDTLKLAPHLVEPNGALDRISSVLLRDDDIYKFDSVNSSGIVDLLPLDRGAVDAAFLKRRKLSPETVSVLDKFHGTGLYEKSGSGAAGAVNSVGASEASGVIEGASGSGKNEIAVKSEASENGAIDESGTGADQDESNEGTRDELLWLIHDLIA